MYNPSPGAPAVPALYFYNYYCLRTPKKYSSLLRAIWGLLVIFYSFGVLKQIVDTCTVLGPQDVLLAPQTKGRSCPPAWSRRYS